MIAIHNTNFQNKPSKPQKFHRIQESQWVQTIKKLPPDPNVNQVSATAQAISAPVKEGSCRKWSG
jgi:hypothetical protein